MTTVNFYMIGGVIMHEPFRLTHDDVLAILNTRNIAYFARGENGYHVINFLEVATKQLEALKTFTEQHMNVYPFSRDVFCIIMTIYKDEVDRSIREARTRVFPPGAAQRSRRSVEFSSGRQSAASTEALSKK